MITIGIIIGTNTSYISDGYYNDNYDKLKVLFNEQLLNEESEIPYDYAIYSEIKHKFKNKSNKYNIIALYGPTLTLKNANKCKYILCIYEGVFSFMSGGINSFNKYMNIIKNTNATVYPSYKLQSFIINKQKYMNYLDKHKFDIIPTKYLLLSKSNADNYLKTTNFIQNNNYKKFIMKPELAGFAGGLKIFNTMNKKTIHNYLDKCRKLEYKKILLQPYIDEFIKFWEIKTYWLDGKYVYAYGTKVTSESDDVIPESHGGTLSDKLINQCRKTGEKLINILFKDFGRQIQLRIDFGCCIDNDNICRNYFINEIECCPTIEDDETIKNNFKLLANTLFKYIDK
jgi:hypothetical protein